MNFLVQNTIHNMNHDPTQLALRPGVGQEAKIADDDEEESKGPSQDRSGPPRIDWSVIQSRLFGREPETNVLMDVYRRKVIQGDTKGEIVIITGPSGTGKTALARLLEPVAEKDGCYFISGKCDMIQEPEPFAPFISAFTQFVDIVITRRKSDIHRVTKAMEFATRESDPSVLTDMIPALEMLIRPRSEGRLQYLEANDGIKENLPTKKARPNSESPSIIVFCKFIEALCSKDHPMVLHIDDWQWLEPSSLALIHALAIAENISGFLLAGTCRGDEVSFDHPLSVVLRTLDEQQINIVEIKVDNLSECVVNEMICELLNLSPEEAAQLASVTHRMTNGNAFYVQQFLRTLEEKGLLYYKNGWCLDEGAISDNQVSLSSKRMLALTVDNLSRQSLPVKEVMQIGSVLGSEFSGRHVQVAASATPMSVSNALNMLVQRGLLQYQKERRIYQWTHDSFQQASFLLIPEDDRAVFPVVVGWQLLDRFSAEELNQNTFIVANLLIKNAEMIDNQPERNRVAAIFLTAGEKAAQSSSFDSAAVYFRKAITLLPEDKWRTQYVLSTSLYNGCAEMECCLGNFQEVEKLVSVVLQETTSLNDKLRAYETQLFSLSARSHMHESIKLGLELLDQLGEPFPKKPGLVHNVFEIVRTKVALRRRSVVDILGLRPLRRWSKAAALRIMQLIFPNVIRVQPEYAVLITTRCIRITLKCGLSPMSATAFSSFAMILAHPVHDIENATKYSEIAMKLQDKFEAAEIRCRLHVMIYSYVRPWTSDARACMPMLLSAGESGLLTGDIELAFISYFIHSMDAVLLGFDLRTQTQRMKKWQEKFAKLRQDTVMFFLKMCQQLVRNLMGDAKDPTVLTSEFFDEKEAIAEVAETKNTTGHAILRTFMLFLAVYLGNTEKAEEQASICRKSNLDSVTGTSYKHILFYSALADISAAIESPNNKKKKKNAGKKELSLLKKWSTYYPKDMASKILFLEAERLALEGLRAQAMEKYHLAIEEASNLGAINEEALACERAAKTLQRWGRNDEAISLFQKASDLYSTWGCKVKVDELSKILAHR